MPATEKNGNGEKPGVSTKRESRKQRDLRFYMQNFNDEVTENLACNRYSIKNKADLPENGECAPSTSRERQREERSFNVTRRIGEKDTKLERLKQSYPHIGIERLLVMLDHYNNDVNKVAEMCKNLEPPVVMTKIVEKSFLNSCVSQSEIPGNSIRHKNPAVRQFFQMPLFGEAVSSQDLVKAYHDHKPKIELDDKKPDASKNKRHNKSDIDELGDSDPEPMYVISSTTISPTGKYKIRGTEYTQDLKNHL